MTLIAKLGLIALGYVAAFVIASAAVAVRIAATSAPDAQAASGMYSAGDAMVFVAVFSICALGPTGGLLFVLRPYRRFWIVLASLVVATAITGLAAVVLFAIGRHAEGSPLAMLGALSVLRILVAPLFVLTFLLFAVLSPYRSPRVAFLAGSVAEVVVSAYGGLVWFVPLFLGRL
jgi:hypothetical protein